MRHLAPAFILPGIPLLFILALVAPSLASETSSPISDREIVERLTRLEEGQKFLVEDIDRRFTDQNRIHDQRFADQNRYINQRFDTIDTRFAEQNRYIDQRFDGIDTRFDGVDTRFTDMNQRITELHQTMLTLFGSLIVLMTALFGYIAWDRRTMFRPLKARQEQMEQQLDRLVEIVETRQDIFGDVPQRGPNRPARPSRTVDQGPEADSPVVSGAARA